MYKYHVEGTAADGQSWQTCGTLSQHGTPGEFMQVLHTALRENFLKLTQGRARFGEPGVGCNGPYAITRFVVEDKNRQPLPATTGESARVLDLLESAEGQCPPAYYCDRIIEIVDGLARARNRLIDALRECVDYMQTSIDEGVDDDSVQIVERACAAIDEVQP